MNSSVSHSQSHNTSGVQVPSSLSMTAPVLSFLPKSKPHPQTEKHSKGKKFQFVNVNLGGQPRAALNHTSVFLSRGARADPNDDEVADEGIDERSRSRVSDRIVNRGSITNRLSNSFDQRLHKPRNSVKQKYPMVGVMGVDLVKVNLDSPVKSPTNQPPPGLVSLNYKPPVKFEKVRSQGGNFTQRSHQNRGINEAMNSIVNNELKNLFNRYIDKKNFKFFQVNLLCSHYRI